MLIQLFSFSFTKIKLIEMRFEKYIIVEIIQTNIESRVPSRKKKILNERQLTLKKIVSFASIIFFSLLKIALIQQ